MKFLPMTVLICLIASLAMAPVFLPVLGGVSGGKRSHHDPEESRFVQGYRKALATLLKRPGLTLLGSLVLIILIYAAYGRFNPVWNSFPVLNRILPRFRCVPGATFPSGSGCHCAEVEQRLQNMPEVKALYARSMLSTSTQMAPDVIGVLQFQFNDWFTRRTATGPGGFP